MLIVSEAVPGPPDVMTKIVSNAFSASIMRMTTATRMNGMISGSVMCLNICQALAPSILADSYGSTGTEARPPKTISMTSGVQCQTSTATRLGITVSGE